MDNLSFVCERFRKRKQVGVFCSNFFQPFSGVGVGGAAAVPDTAQGPELGNIIRMMNVAPDCDGWHLARNQPLLECLSSNIDTQLIFTAIQLLRFQDA